MDDEVGTREAAAQRCPTGSGAAPAAAGNFICARPSDGGPAAPDADRPEERATDARTFASDLEAELPALRMFAQALSRNAANADDLTQEAILKAWASRHRFELGTNLRAWLFTILRNTFYSEYRKRRREVSDSDGYHAQLLATRPIQEHALVVNGFVRALAALPDEQREALVLIGASGLTYEEAAAVTGVAVGTVKSRVSRARHWLMEVLEIETGDGLFSDPRMDAAVSGALYRTGV